jgi:hypothetical protein
MVSEKSIFIFHFSNLEIICLFYEIESQARKKEEGCDRHSRRIVTFIIWTTWELPNYDKRRVAFMYQ